MQKSLGRLAKGAGWALQALWERCGKVLQWFRIDRVGSGNTWLRQGCGRQRYARMRSSMLSEMISGITRIIVVNGTMIVVMVVRRAHEVVDFVGNVECTRRRIPTALHREAMQR